MISIICTFNNKDVLRKNLLPTLKKQSKPYDLVLINNTHEKFHSASSSLNYAFKQTNPRSKYIFFAHQDFSFIQQNDLILIEKELNKITKLGVAGFAGKDRQNRRTGYVLHFTKPWGRKLSSSKEVLTIDELGFIIPRAVFNKHQFDQKTFDGWHCYCADYCLWAKKKGLKVTVLPIGVQHNTSHQALSDKSLFYYQSQLLKKYPEYKKIYTTNGTISRLTLFLRKFPINDKVLFYYKEKLLAKSKYLRRFRFSTDPNS